MDWILKIRVKGNEIPMDWLNKAIRENERQDRIDRYVESRTKDMIDAINDIKKANGLNSDDVV